MDVEESMRRSEICIYTVEYLGEVHFLGITIRCCKQCSYGPECICVYVCVFRARKGRVSFALFVVDNSHCVAITMRVCGHVCIVSISVWCEVVGVYWKVVIIPE